MEGYMDNLVGISTSLIDVYISIRKDLIHQQDDVHTYVHNCNLKYPSISGGKLFVIKRKNNAMLYSFMLFENDG